MSGSEVVSTPELGMILTLVDYWLDTAVADTYKDQPLAQDWARVGKVIEELGEAVNALIGMTGQNPRKGEYATRLDMLNELADVAATALFAIQHFTKDSGATLAVFSAKMRLIRQRVPDAYVTGWQILDGDDRRDTPSMTPLGPVNP